MKRRLRLLASAGALSAVLLALGTPTQAASTAPGSCPSIGICNPTCSDFCSVYGPDCHTNCNSALCTSGWWVHCFSF